MLVTWCLAMSLLFYSGAVIFSNQVGTVLDEDYILAGFCYKMGFYCTFLLSFLTFWYVPPIIPGTFFRIWCVLVSLLIACLIVRILWRLFFEYKPSKEEDLKPLPYLFHAHMISFAVFSSFATAGFCSIIFSIFLSLLALGANS